MPIVKITSGQRLALVGVKAEDLSAMYKNLAMAPGKATELCPHSVQARPGTEVCKFGVRDSLGFGIRFENMLDGRQLPESSCVKKEHIDSFSHIFIVTFLLKWPRLPIRSPRDVLLPPRSTL